MGIKTRSIDRLKKDGFIGLIRTTRFFLADLLKRKYTTHLRSLRPITRYAERNGVVMPPDVAEPRRMFDELIPFSIIETDTKNSEGGEVASHKNQTRAGDTVVTIGGGYGITTVNAARECGPDGRVIVFEGSRKCVDIINRVAELNDVGERVEVRHAIVGPEINVYNEGESVAPDFVDPRDIPDCDVLEMDCEGAEIEILERMEIRPRVIIVEVHPGRNPDSLNVISQLNKMGYRIEDQWTNDGKMVTESGFNVELTKHVKGSGGAPVLAAVYDAPN